MDVPQCFDIQTLKDFLEKLPLDIQWYFGDFEGSNKVEVKEYGFIVGPEGGFSKDELELLKNHAKGVKLSDNILRAETAAIVSMSF